MRCAANCPERSRLARRTSRPFVVAALVAVVLVAVPSLAGASAVVSRDGEIITAQGSAAGDSVAFRYYVPGEDGPGSLPIVNEPAYLFYGAPSFLDRDANMAPGPGCSHPQYDYPQNGQPYLVACPAAGVTQIGIALGDGSDFSNLGWGRAMPAVTVVARGGTGDDQIISDARSTAEHHLFGDEGDDALSAFSLEVRAHMDGGAGNDRFGWEGTARGTPTSADGGPGDDTFRAREARGAETINGGDGIDDIDVHDNGAGDADTVTCGQGLDALTADSSDTVSGDCEPAPTREKVDTTVRRDTSKAKTVLRRARLRTLLRNRLALPLSGPWLGTYSAELTAHRAQGSKVLASVAFKPIAKASRRVTEPGRFRLRLRLTKSGRALARRSPGLRVRLRLTYAVSRLNGQAPLVGSRLTGATLKSGRR